MREFEKAVKIALIDKGMTMTDLADAIDLSVSYVSDLLKKKRTTEKQIKRICTYLELDGDLYVSNEKD